MEERTTKKSKKASEIHKGSGTDVENKTKGKEEMQGKGKTKKLKINILWNDGYIFLFLHLLFFGVISSFFSEFTFII